jgi:3-oxoacyl-[acyl-carrier protein] reductase
MEISKAKVLITGGSSGIGYETAKLLRSQGAEVVICGRNEETILKAAKEIDVHGFKADVANEADVQALFEFTLKTLGGLNVLINNAGIGYFAPLVSTSMDEFQSIWDVNVKGLVLCGQAAARHFVAENTGNIINISSSAGLKGFANGTAYVATKFAVTGITECWRAELRKNNVRVMQINPSEVVTHFGAKAGYEHKNQDSKLKPSEIAHVIHSMLSMNDVGFITDATVWATNPQ